MNIIGRSLAIQPLAKIHPPRMDRYWQSLGTSVLTGFCHKVHVAYIYYDQVFAYFYHHYHLFKMDPQYEVRNDDGPTGKKSSFGFYYIYFWVLTQ